jgi:hypothetical protein
MYDSVCWLEIEDMQTPERYWEGLYWDGFSPDKIGMILRLPPLNTLHTSTFVW